MERAEKISKRDGGVVVMDDVMMLFETKGGRGRKKGGNDGDNEPKNSNSQPTRPHGRSPDRNSSTVSYTSAIHPTASKTAICRRHKHTLGPKSRARLMA